MTMLVKMKSWSVKLDALFKQRLQKSRYIVWDIETFALNQQSGKGRQVPHLLIAATTCYQLP